MASMLIQVNTDLLGRDKTAMQDRLQAFNAALKKIYADVSELDAMWEGIAHEAFRQQFTNDQTQFEELCKAMAELIQNLQFAKTEYDKCEEQVRAAIQAIKG